MTHIGKYCLKYVIGSVSLIAILTTIALFLEYFEVLEKVMLPIGVCALASLVIELADIFIWKYVATKHPDALTTFYTAVSGFRMLASLAIMFVYYMMDPMGTASTFIISFIIYYFVTLAHHAMFFSKMAGIINDKLKNQKENNVHD